MLALDREFMGVLAIVRRDGQARLLDTQPAPRLIVDEEIFTVSSPCQEWLGFHEWLRTVASDIMEVRLQAE